MSTKCLAQCLLWRKHLSTVGNHPYCHNKYYDNCKYNCTELNEKGMCMPMEYRSRAFKSVSRIRKALSSKMGFPGGTVVKNKPACLCWRHETRVWSLGQEDCLEKGMATHFSILPPFPVSRVSMVSHWPPWSSATVWRSSVSSSAVSGSCPPDHKAGEVWDAADAATNHQRWVSLCLLPGDSHRHC